MDDFNELDDLLEEEQLMLHQHEDEEPQVQPPDDDDEEEIDAQNNKRPLENEHGTQQAGEVSQASKRPKTADGGAGPSGVASAEAGSIGAGPSDAGPSSSGAGPSATSQQQQLRAALVQQSQMLEQLLQRNYMPPSHSALALSGRTVDVRSEDGVRVYCKIDDPQHDADRQERTGKLAVLRMTCGMGLLAQPIELMLEQVEQAMLDRLSREANGASSPPAAAGGAASASSPSTTATPGRRSKRGGGGKSGGKAGGSSLWVQKYAPRSFLDLLSDERVNREVLKWVKSWDSCVFGESAAQQQQRRARLGVAAVLAGGGGIGAVAGMGSDGRPEHKVVLISGPPGLGKTTLAHIVAKHCGYRPVEINASDDRSGGALQNKLEAAVRMQPVFGDKRPNCLVVDEVDGVAGGPESRSGIHALLKMVMAKPGGGGKSGGSSGKSIGGGSTKAGGAAGGDNGDGDEDDSDDDGGGDGDGGGSKGSKPGAAAGMLQLQRQGGGGRRRKGPGPLRRPVICICNDLYAPALRPLREVAKVFAVRKPNAERLVQRLAGVCQREGLAAERQALVALVRQTDCDVRSCLNTLQFVARRQSSFKLSDLRAAGCGSKDSTKSAFDMWNKLFTRQRQQPGGRQHAATASGSSADSGASSLLDELLSYGEGELLTNGMHENLYSARYFDVDLQRTCAALQALGDADLLGRAAGRQGAFGLQAQGAAVGLMRVRRLVAGHDRLQLQWPSTRAEVSRRQAAHQQLLSSWMGSLAPETHCFLGHTIAATEVVPCLLGAVAPSVRPVAPQLLTPAEKGELQRCVDVCLAYGVTYSLADLSENAPSVTGPPSIGGGGGPAAPPVPLKPALDSVCSFPGLPPSRKAVPLAVRQGVCQAVETQRIQRREAARCARGGEGSGAAAGVETDGSQALAAAAPVVAPPTRDLSTVRMPAKGTGGLRTASNWLTDLQTKRRDKGNTRTGPGAGAANGQSAAGGGIGKAQAPQPQASFKFFEGYTNAVKRPLITRDLL